jgi:tRNA nucleotidyltransferase (CCA-adding enzyme)
VALEWWRSTGALRALIPAIAGAPEERFLALDHLPVPRDEDDHGATLDRLTMLFFGETAKATAATAKSLKFSNADTKWMTHLAEAHHAIGGEIDAALARGDPDRATVRRWVARVGRTRTPAFLALTTALWHARLGARPDPLVEARLGPLAAAAADVAFRDPVELADLAVDGEDLRSAGIGPGPRVGSVLQALLARVIADPAENTRDHLLELAVRFANDGPR